MASYPSDTNRLVKVLRFLNTLDPDSNELSPVRIQAWIATAVAATDLLQRQVQVAPSVLALVFAAMAHITHQFDKNNRAKNAALLKDQ